MIRYIHSLDIGCGSVSAFTGKYDPEHPETLPEPTPLTAEGGEPAICAVKQDGSYLVGDLILALDDNAYLSVKNFETGFLNVSDTEHCRRLVRYLQAWREYLQAKHPAAFPTGKEKGCEEYWVVGIPAGWRAESKVEAYRQAALDRGWEEDTSLDIHGNGSWGNPIDTRNARYDVLTNSANIEEYLYGREYAVDRSPEEMYFNLYVEDEGDHWVIYFIFGYGLKQ